MLRLAVGNYSPLLCWPAQLHQPRQTRDGRVTTPSTSASKQFHPKVRNYGEGSYYTRAFSWLKEATTAFTFKTLLRHYAERTLTPRSLNVKLGPRRKGHKGRAGWLA